MVRTLTISLRPTPEQANALQETMEAFNAACNYVSLIAWEERQFNLYRLRARVYGQVRERFGLPAQLAHHAIAKVANAYKVNKQVRAHFRPLGAVTYDRRVMRLIGVSFISMTLRSGREKIALSTGGYHAERLRGAILGEADLTFEPEQRRFRLHLSLKFPDPPQRETEGFLGVDLGIRNIAADSDGNLYAGGKLRRKRKRHRRIRQRLQKLGTRGARRLLAKRRQKERRHATHVNHCISKKLVAAAKGTGRGIAVEDLSGIRERTTVRRVDRAEHSGWAFHQLRFFLEYKCLDAGVPFVAVDPRNSSCTCPACGCIDKRNRPTQAVFRCIQCGVSGHADLFAAREIALRGCLVSQPNCPVENSPRKESGFCQGKVSSPGVAECPHPLGVG